MKIHNREICVISLPDEPATVYAVQNCRIMAHQTDDFGHFHSRNHIHQLEAVPDGWESGLAREVAVSAFLLLQMRGMVRTYGVNETAVNSLNQSRTVVGRLDCRIALYLIAQIRVSPPSRVR